MHSIVVLVGLFLVLIIAVHLIFRIIKFTLGVFVLGVALVGVVYVFQYYFGIDLLNIIARHAA